MKSLATILSLLICSSANAKTLRLSLEELRTQAGLIAENHANSSYFHQDFELSLEHFEIPFDLLHVFLGTKTEIPPEIMQAFTFERDGKRWFRWIIHPADQYYSYLVKRKLEDLGLSAKRHFHYTGFLTASRSLYVRDPLTTLVYSVKISTNRLVKRRRVQKGRVITQYEKQFHKLYKFTEARSEVITSQVLAEQAKKAGLRQISFIEDLAAFGFIDYDKQAMSIRSAEAIGNGPFMFVPLFAVLHETFGRELAAYLGSDNPEKFWRKHLLEPLAAGFAELFVKLGVTLFVPHGQNILMELSKENLMPTGRFKVRDPRGSYIAENFAQSWKLKNLKGLRVVKGKQALSFFLLGYNPHKHLPSWLPQDIYANQWKSLFFQVFEKNLQSNGFSDLQFSKYITANETTLRVRFPSLFKKYYRHAGGGIRCVDLSAN